VQQVMNKRSSGQNKHVNTAIANLYLPSKQSQKPITAADPRQPNMDFTQTSQLSQVTPYQPPKKRMQQNLSQPRTQTQGKRSEMNVFTQQDHE
jgi:hypothetical protein